MDADCEDEIVTGKREERGSGRRGGRGSYSPTTGRPRPCRDVRVDRHHLLPVVVSSLLVVLVVLVVLGLVVAWCLLS